VKRTYATWIVASCVLMAMSACAERASRQTETGEAAPPTAKEARPAGEAAAAKAVPPPPSSPLAKVKEGMGMKEVSDLLGQPTDQNQYVTGKAFIPWYFGDDVSRIEWHYKGMGRVVFTGGGAWGQQGGRVQWVEYDPSESGYRR